ncbi:transcription factor HES-5-like isoform X2 [Ascaphus truei]|uniref:transcription factor HES-5-like isoform X2 n=1 Tax=Ascaphus truei TaxID=8439 RepID=UPI003F5A5E93
MAPCKIRIQNADGHIGEAIRNMRKPVVEKMRRDRINSSIEQLKTLLEKEFQKHELPSKPEKADILEMTVSFLQQHMAEKYVATSSHAHREGYSKCFQDTLRFLSGHDQTESHQWKLLRHFHSHQTASEDVYNATPTSTKSFPGQPIQNRSKALWRPW